MQQLSDISTPIPVILLVLIAVYAICHKFGLFDGLSKKEIEKQSDQMLATMDRNVAERN